MKIQEAYLANKGFGASENLLAKKYVTPPCWQLVHHQDKCGCNESKQAE